MADESEDKGTKRLSPPGGDEDEPQCKKLAVKESSSADTDWNVDECRGDHESVEHWELRKNFLVENMGRFPKSRLICLSQVFANVEFLGCRYPEETMAQVQELSYGIVEGYREKQKTRLQRTFVKASDAAERKTKGNCNRVNKVSAVDQIDIKANNKYSNFVAASIVSDAPKCSTENQNSPYPDLQNLILLVYSYAPNESAVQIIHRSCETSKTPISCTYENSGESDEHVICQYQIGEFLTIQSDPCISKDSTKVNTAKLVLKELLQFCYTFVTKESFRPENAGKEISKDDIEDPKSTSTPPISNNNIGNKLLKLMGWTGGGLGKSEQGIHEAISVDGVVGRSRLGLGNRNADALFQKKITELLKRQKDTGFTHELKFSTDFSKDERKSIHSIALRLGLKSKSYGKDDDRYIVISEKVSRTNLMKTILQEGGETDKYSVILPASNSEYMKKYI